MDAMLVTLFGRLVAVQCEMEGMKAENAWRIAMGQTPAYGEEKFNGLAELARHIAEQARG
jgi:hypothetical protein